MDQRLSQDQLRTISLARDKGASGWLNVFPLEEEGYVLNTEEFRDALALRYDKCISNLPSYCPCEKQFNMTHAMDCKTGGFMLVMMLLEIWRPSYCPKYARMLQLSPD